MSRRKKFNAVATVIDISSRFGGVRRLNEPKNDETKKPTGTIRIPLTEYLVQAEKRVDKIEQMLNELEANVVKALKLHDERIAKCWDAIKDLSKSK